MRHQELAEWNRANFMKKNVEFRYVVIFLVQFLILTGFRVYHEIVYNPTAALTTFMNVIDGSGPIIVFVTFSTLMIQDGGPVLAERYLRRRHAEGKEEGREEGRVEGRIEGEQRANNRWADWNNRRMEAEAEGRPFDEPPPDVNGKVNSI